MILLLARFPPTRRFDIRFTSFDVHGSLFDFARAEARVYFFFGCLHPKEFESSATSRKFRPGLASVVVSTDAARSRQAAAQLN